MPSDDDQNLNPTDIQILTALDKGNRQTPKNLGVLLNRDSAYISGRSRSLIRAGYADDPGPADKSGMVEISITGRVAVAHLDCYLQTYYDTFHKLCERVAGVQPDLDDTEFNTDAVELTESEEQVLDILQQTSGVVIPSQIASHSSVNLNTEEAADALYALYFYGLIERHEDMDAYSLSNNQSDTSPLATEF